MEIILSRKDKLKQAIFVLNNMLYVEDLGQKI